MKTKIVYVLTSTEKDFYLEQTFLSIYSLRLHNYNAHVVLIVDKNTALTLVDKRAHIKEYIDELLIVDTPNNFNNLRKSRFLKTSMRNLTEGDFLYIDSDTIISKPLNDIDNIEFELGGVADKHMILKNHPMKDTILKQVIKTNLTFDINRHYINSGVFLVKDTPTAHKLFELWHNKWLELQNVMTLDQPPLAWADNELGHPINLLNDTWNCQVLDNGLRILNDSYIIHYFASSANSNKNSAYALYDNQIYYEIKKKGIITKEIKELLENPYSAFNPICRVIAGDDIQILDSEWYKLYKRYPILFKLMGNISVILAKGLKKIGI